MKRRGFRFGRRLLPGRLLPRRLLPGLLVAAVLVCLGWGAGFVWFVRDAMQAGAMQAGAMQAGAMQAGAMQAGRPPPRADGIVALTGGADRIETAMRLLAEGRARLLLVSGVGPGSDLPELAHRAGYKAAAMRPAVTLGHAATTTVGNAAEAAAWARAHDLHSLIVVTSGYHMERALTEIARALPDVRLYPVAVLSPAVSDPRAVGTLKLLAAEYTKFIAADLGLTHLSWPQGGA